MEPKRGGKLVLKEVQRKNRKRRKDSKKDLTLSTRSLRGSTIKQKNIAKTPRRREKG